MLGSEMYERHLRLGESMPFSQGPTEFISGHQNRFRRDGLYLMISQRHIYSIKSKLIHLKANIYYEWRRNWLQCLGSQESDMT